MWIARILEIKSTLVETEKGLPNLPLYTPLADLEMSSLAPCRSAEALEIYSLVIGRNVGSIRRSLHTSESRPAVNISLCLIIIIGKPLLAQERACSAENVNALPTITLILINFDGNVSREPTILQCQGVDPGKLNCEE